MPRRQASSDDLTRRDFMWHAACAAVGATAMASTVWDLRMINAALAQTATPPTDYKALVCIFLFGGNDNNNTIIPNDSFYSAYSAARGPLAVPQSQLLPIHPIKGDGRAYAFHYAMPELQNLFNTGKVAVVCNAGTLVAPITRAQYLSQSVPVPQQLFSHSNQQVQWQTCASDRIVPTGWGGRCADLLNAAYNNSSFAMSISLAGTNTWEVGNIVSEYDVATTGPKNLEGPDANQVQALKDLIALNHGNAYEKQSARTTQTALDNYATLNNALAGANLATTFTDGNPLADQLRTIARIIKARQTLGHKRQIFFASLSGFDSHGKQYFNHADRLYYISTGLNDFNNALIELGVQDSVTTFTASDFGRTFPANDSEGSDHGWGAHHLVMGGAVKGQQLYGTYPTLAVNGPDDTGLGRWIPTISVEEYSATLAKWFGVPDANLKTIFPNIGNFARPDLGFLNVP